MTDNELDQAKAVIDGLGGLRPGQACFWNQDGWNHGYTIRVRIIRWHGHRHGTDAYVVTSLTDPDTQWSVDRDQLETIDGA